MTYHAISPSGPIFLLEKNSKYQYMEHCLLPFLEEFLEEHHRVIESRLSSVSREITDSRACVREELESLYRKIVSYVLLRSGLGSPTDIKIVREATGKKCTPFPFHVWTYMNIISYKIWWITCVEHWSFLLWSEKKKIAQIRGWNLPTSLLHNVASLKLK